MAKRAKGTGTLRKRKDGRWEGRVAIGKDENGKMKYKSVMSVKKTDCQHKLDALIAEIEKGKRNEECKYGGCFEFYYLELTTGLRLGEILALEWDDLDVKNKTLSISKQVQRIKGQGMVLETPKTKNSIRTIALPSNCVTALARLRLQQARGTTLMFPSPLTGTYRDSNSVTRRFKRMLRRAGLPQEVRFHDLRHTCATIGLEEEIEVKALSSMLGHSDVAFTMNTYVHATKKIKTTAADKMEAAFQIGYSSVMNVESQLKDA